MKSFKIWSLIMIACLLVGLSSCSKDATLVDTENFSDSAINDLQKGVVGKQHCLEFIFPISIAFIDESTAEVESYEDLHETILSWFETNDVEKDKENKPSLVFPLQVVNQEGELIDVASAQDLKELKSECPKEGRCGKGKGGKGYTCFSLVFPLSLNFDGEIQSFEDQDSLKEAVKAYKEEAGQGAPRPALVFPVAIAYEDGTEVTVNDKEELKALKEACQDEEDEDGDE